MERNEEIDQRMHERLCALVLGEVDEAERAALEAELAGSAALRGERERLEKTIGLVRGALGAADLQLSAASRERISAAAQRPSHARRWYVLPRPQLLRMAAGALALVGAGWIVVRARSDRGPSEDGMTIARLDQQEAAMKRERSSTPDDAKDQLALVDRAERDDQAQLGAEIEAAPESRLAKSLGSKAAPERAEGGGTYRGPGDPVPNPALGEKLALDADTAGVPQLLPGHATINEESKNVFQQLDELAVGYAPHVAPPEQPYGETLHSGVPFDTGAAPAEKKDEPGLRQSDGSAVGNEPASTPAATATAAGAVGQVSGFTGQGGGTSTRGASAVVNNVGAGPSTPGPSGASAPSSPAPPPGSSGAATGGTPIVAGGDYQYYTWRDTAAALGYVGGDDGEAKRSGSDDFFLGRGEAGGVPRTRFQAYATADDLIRAYCFRYPSERPRDMFFRFWGDNAFELTAKDSLSTFGADVDTASYALARSYLRQGHVPEKAQIRTEEFVNYFKPDLAPPTGERTFELHLELAPSRFGGSRSERWMLRAGLRGREVSRSERKPVALTFVMDVSGSMKEGNRLELVKHALRLLTGELHASDTISIVAFSNDARLVLPATSASQRGLIEAALFGLEANGGTNAEAGLRLGYEQALANRIEGAVNRVVLLSDGVANIGQVNQDRINADVERQRDQGILLNTVGVGMNNHNDTFLEQLADKGDGLCNYVDTPAEARRALVDNFTGAFEVIAKDVKIQVEFDPSQVRRYRLLGYENRAIADQDFRNDRVDAGEIGAGHQVTALYELELAGAGDPECAIATLRVRYKGPEAKPEDAAREITRAIGIGSASGSFGGTTSGYRRSAVVAQFAELLRRSVHARGDSLDELIAEAGKLERELADPDFTEFYAMLVRSKELVLSRLGQPDELALAIDGLRECAISRAELEELGSADAERMNELLRQEAILQQRIRELWERMQQSRDR